MNNKKNQKTTSANSTCHMFKIEPYFRYKIWGGERLKEFNLKIPFAKTGEAWLISAVKGCESYVPFYKMNLRKLWDENPHNIFGKKIKGEFPLLTKILDANDQLSVQVHPNNAIALKKHHCLGKAESWYFLKAPQDRNKGIVYGHNAKNKAQCETMIANNNWDQLLRYVKVQENDFAYVPPGKVHSLTTGTLVLEIQQSSDITYRMYDFDRKDQNGKPRELHINESIAAITYPDSDLPIKNTDNGNLIDNDYFTIDVLTTKQKPTTYKIAPNRWVQFTVIAGKGKINNTDVKKGDAYIIACQHELQYLSISNNLKVIFSYQK